LTHLNDVLKYPVQTLVNTKGVLIMTLLIKQKSIVLYHQNLVMGIIIEFNVTYNIEWGCDKKFEDWILITGVIRCDDVKNFC
jgi:hypothetical protein